MPSFLREPVTVLVIMAAEIAGGTIIVKTAVPAMSRGKVTHAAAVAAIAGVHLPILEQYATETIGGTSKCSNHIGVQRTAEALRLSISAFLLLYS